MTQPNETSTRRPCMLLYGTRVAHALAYPSLDSRLATKAPNLPLIQLPRGDTYRYPAHALSPFSQNATDTQTRSDIQLPKADALSSCGVTPGFVPVIERSPASTTCNKSPKHGTVQRILVFSRCASTADLVRAQPMVIMPCNVTAFYGI